MFVKYIHAFNWLNIIVLILYCFCLRAHDHQFDIQLDMPDSTTNKGLEQTITYIDLSWSILIKIKNINYYLIKIKYI